MSEWFDLKGDQKRNRFLLLIQQDRGRIGPGTGVELRSQYYSGRGNSTNNLALLNSFMTEAVII